MPKSGAWSLYRFSLLFWTVSFLVKNVFYASIFLLLASLLIDCKDTSPGFSSGAGDPRIVGTWRLVERRFPIDSVYLRIDSFFVKGSTRIDSMLVNGQYKRDTIITKDGYKKDTIRASKSIDTTRRYAATPPQLLLFAADGKLSASGSEMTYYYPFGYFRVDSADVDGVRTLGINLFITTNGATVPSRQGVRFGRDTLTFLPRCDRPQRCYSKFVRAQ